MRIANEDAAAPADGAEGLASDIIDADDPLEERVLHIMPRRTLGTRKSVA
jgi:hypothetical protein